MERRKVGHRLPVAYVLGYLPQNFVRQICIGLNKCRRARRVISAHHGTRWAASNNVRYFEIWELW